MKTLFRQFVDEMDSMLKENDSANGMSQRDLLNKLFKIEAEFKKNLLSSRSGEIVYEKFMNFILDDKENKLSIRPYFRERQDTFSNKVFPILKAKKAERLHRFRINYMFARWALDVYKGPNKRRLNQLYDQMLECRRLLCENNLPLAINRAKLFWSNVPPGSLEYMDLIQDSSKGLLEAIDKFVPPYKTVFRSVAIGRMTLNMIEDNSATLLKMSPKEKRILYRARKAKLKNTDISGKDLQSFVNESFSDTKASDIENITAAADHVVSMDHTDDGSRPMYETLEDPSSTEASIERAEATSKMLISLNNLSILDQKIILLKHGEIFGVLKKYES